MACLRRICPAISQITSTGPSLARTFASGAFTSLPIIDVSPLVAPNAPLPARTAVGRAIHAACRDVGFFYITGVDRFAAAGQEARDHVRAWFALPDAVKSSILLSPQTHYRGYQPLGLNVTQGARDWHEGLDLYREVDPESAEAKTLSPSPIHGLNPWPPGAPALQAALRRYVSACLVLGKALMRGIALGLELPEETFFEQPGTAENPYWVLRAISYPPLPPGLDPGSLSCGAHSDYGLLTLVSQDEDPRLSALQVLNGNGDWVPAPPVPGTFVVNIGDMLRVWTNGMYTPTMHRVVHPGTGARVSLPFFYEPSFDAVVEPIPALMAASGRPPLPPVRYGAHLEGKVLSNFAKGPAVRGHD
jgi:isopenicillin N synthase-like dioxygenase